MLTYYPMGLSDFKGVLPHAKTVDSLMPDFGKPREGMKFQVIVLCKLPVIPHLLCLERGVQGSSYPTQSTLPLAALFSPVSHVPGGA